ncbi:MAG: phytoene desaturase [Chitinophagaceae bacterium]|nr:phytoene desaturase [Chitinophagaceae bacterium]
MQDPAAKVIVIGSGIAGLAAAIRLASAGRQVIVYEKNGYPGGKLHAFEQNGYHFDAGPSLFTQPQQLAELFALAGEPLNDYFQYRRLPVSCHYFYEDGTCLKAYADRELFKKEIAEKTSADPARLDTYLANASKAYSRIGSVFLDHSLHKPKTLWKAPVSKALLATRWPYLFRSLHQFNRKQLVDEKLVQLFDRYATFNGSDPYRAPGMLSMIPHLEHNEGAFYPQGGMISIVNALYQLALKKGVEFHFNAPVQRIIAHENKAVGVVVNNSNILSTAVLSNIDSYFTYRYLLGDERSAKKIARQERSSSAMIFYWGIKKEFPRLDLHNIFFSGDYKAEFDHLFRSKSVYYDPTVYVNISSKQEPGRQAPAGKENWFVMVNTPASNGQDWTAYRQQYRQAVIEKLNRALQTDIESLIETETVMDPAGIETSSGSFMGALYGTSSNSRLAAFLRHPNFSKRIAGLYFAGGSVHPGGGIPLCMRSAKIAANLILQG